MERLFHRTSECRCGRSRAASNHRPAACRYARTRHVGDHDRKLSEHRRAYAERRRYLANWIRADRDVGHRRFRRQRPDRTESQLPGRQLGDARIYHAQRWQFCLDRERQRQQQRGCSQRSGRTTGRSTTFSTSTPAPTHRSSCRILQESTSTSLCNRLTANRSSPSIIRTVSVRHPCWILSRPTESAVYSSAA